jgi:hypothetical protein
MSDHLAFIQAIAEPMQRRCWLLSRALDFLPPDEAMDWAQQADDFIVRGNAGPRSAVAAVRPDSAAVTAPHCGEARIEARDTVTVAPASERPAAPGRPTIAADRRQQLIERLASGAKNADLAAEFGLTAKQVQGVRIGCGREIAARREAVKPHPVDHEPAATTALAAPPATSIDEVVRYLRQQDDVVVPQASGEFLVNARFRLPPDELVSRANRMRARQGKPEFVFTNGANGHAAAAHLASANGHAIA